VAAWRTLEKAKSDLKPAYLAGHSLGEYSAHVASGTLTFADAIRTVRKRGQFMQEAVPVGEGAMAALMGIESDAASAACAEAAQGQVVVTANDNAPGQIVIAGHAAAVQRAIEAAKARGCKKAVPLPVSAPFHSPLMAPAREKLSPVLQSLPFKNPRWPVVANVDALPTGTAEDARRKLIAQVDAPVRWRETLLYFQGAGVEAIVEVGPGTVLCGLAKRVSKEWKLLSIEDSASLDKTLAALG